MAEIEVKSDIMTKTAKCLGFLFVLAFIFCAPAISADSVPVNEVLASVSVKGNSSVSSDIILSAISIRPGEPIDQEKINSDLKAIYSLGYFSDVKTAFVNTGKGTQVVYKVKENPVLRSIVIEGNTVYSTAELLSICSSKIGLALSYKSVQTDVQSIEAKYQDAGYILAKVVDVTTDADKHILKIRLIEGVIDSIILEGNTSTKDYVILREINSKAGTVLNEKTLGKDLRRVFNLGFFSEVTPDFQPTSSPDRISLVLKIKEGKTNTVNFGGGYGETEGWFGFVDLSTENLFGTGQGLLVRGQAGQQQQTYQLKYTYPWLFPDKLGDRVLFSARRWLTIGKNVYLVETIEKEGIYNGWEVGFSKPINDEWSVGLTLGSEKVDPTGSATFEPYTSNTIGLSLSYDTRDNWMNPSKGQYHTLGLRRGWKMASSANTDFTKWSLDFSQYLKVAQQQTIAAHLGFGLGLGDVPVGEIYYAGGSNTVRGYEPYEARTGVKRILLNLEYRYTFNDMFQGVLFFDWGNAWNNGWPNTYDFISGKGFGLRLNTPMGPIRLDYGVGANRSFSEGVLHFSIGQAF